MCISLLHVPLKGNGLPQYSGLPCLSLSAVEDRLVLRVLRVKHGDSVSVGRGAVVSGILISLLPVVAGPDSIWFAMPVTEAITAIYAAAGMMACTPR